MKGTDIIKAPYYILLGIGVRGGYPNVTEFASEKLNLPESKRQHFLAESHLSAASRTEIVWGDYIASQKHAQEYLRLIGLQK